MKAYNGVATYEVDTVANREGTKRKVVTRPAKITPKRVETATRVWDHSGFRITAWHPGMMSTRLLSFQKDGESLQIINREATK